MMSNQIIFLGNQLHTNDIERLVDTTTKVALDEKYREKVKQCREILISLNKNEDPVYGVSTGFGHLENTWIPTNKQQQLQVNLIRSHAIATGPEIPAQITRTAMILLANSLAKGYSGIRIETLDLLIKLINDNIIPVTYSIGSLGASGDLAPLAHVALCLIGEGEVWLDGKKVSTKEVFEKNNLVPLTLEAKEGLALINGTHFVTAYAAHVYIQSKSLIWHSLLAISLTLEAVRGTDAAFSDSIARVRGHPGHIVIARLLRKMLKGSQIIESHKDPKLDHKTQDDYSLRCVPQTLGAIWDAFAYLENALVVEINAVTDNPLIFVQNRSIISGGNFHAEPLGLPLETISMGLVELANITEARISKLVSPYTKELPAFLANEPGTESGYMIAHYTTAALVNRLRGLSHPNLTDNIPVSGGKEDFVSMAMGSATKSWEIVNLVKEVVAFELLMAVRGLNLVDRKKSSEMLEEIITRINQSVPFDKQDHVIRTKHQQMIELMQTHQLIKTAQKWIDFPSQFNVTV